MMKWSDVTATLFVVVVLAVILALAGYLAARL